MDSSDTEEETNNTLPDLTRRDLGIGLSSLLAGASVGYFGRQYRLEQSRTYDQISDTVRQDYENAGDLPLSIGSRPKYGELSSPIRIF